MKGCSFSAFLRTSPFMTALWRISNYVDLSGEGAKMAPGRWHTLGALVVYLAENPAGAMLECIVHLMDFNEDGNLPPNYQLLQIPIPEGLATKHLNTIAPADWKERPEFTRSMGDAWLASMESPL